MFELGYYCDTATDFADDSSKQNHRNVSSGLPSAPGLSPNPTPGSLSKGAKVGIGLGVGGSIVLTTLTFLIRWRCRKRKADLTALLAEKEGFEVDGAAMLSNDEQKHELEQPLSEMPLGREAQELPAKHAISRCGTSMSGKTPEGTYLRHELPANEEPHLASRNAGTSAGVVG